MHGLFFIPGIVYHVVSWLRFSLSNLREYPSGAPPHSPPREPYRMFWGVLPRILSPGQTCFTMKNFPLVSMDGVCVCSPRKVKGSHLSLSGFQVRKTTVDIGALHTKGTSTYGYQ